jgi:hypothetical protein
MRRAWFVVLVLAAGPNLAPAADSHKDCDKKIARLEERVAQLERMLGQLAAQREPLAPALPEPDRAPAAERDDRLAKSLAKTPPAKYETPPELVPDVGKIGAQVGLLLSGSGSPFKLGSGSYTGGFIDLPMFESRALRGKFGYEIVIGVTQSNTTFNTTSNVAQVANLTVLNTLNPSGGLANVVAAVSGTGPAPFPVTNSTLTRLRLLQVVPFSIKYTHTALDRFRLRPYATLGFGAYVTIHSQNPARGTPASFGVRPDAMLPPDVLAAVGQIFGGKAPFGGPLVAGQISQSPELEARGLPGGHGNFDLGVHSALGVEYRLHRNFSLGFDGRFNKIAGTNGFYRTYGSRIGFHW